MQGTRAFGQLLNELDHLDRMRHKIFIEQTLRFLYSKPRSSWEELGTEAT